MNERDRAMLDFESKWWAQRGNKEREIVRIFEISVVRYVQVLNRVLDDPEAMAYNPILVNRLRRVRSERTVAREQRKGLYG